MSTHKLIIPVGAAVAALFATDSYADKPPVVEKQQSLTELEGSAKTGKESSGSILQRLQYQIGDQAHELMLHKSPTEIMYARHGSHRSHGSHGSHRSGR